MREHLCICCFCSCLAVKFDAVSAFAPRMLQGPQREVCLHGTPRPCQPRPPILPDPQPPQIAPIRCQRQKPHGKTLGLPQNLHGRLPDPWPPCGPLLLQQDQVTLLQDSHPPRLPSPATKGVPMTCCQIHCLVACRQASTHPHHCCSLLPAHAYYSPKPCV